MGTSARSSTLRATCTTSSPRAMRGRASPPRRRPANPHANPNPNPDSNPNPKPSPNPNPNPSPNPSPSPDQVAFWAIPLLGCGACALPHFRALFSAARPVARRGHKAGLLSCSRHTPLASPRWPPEKGSPPPSLRDGSPAPSLGRAADAPRAQWQAAARPWPRSPRLRLPSTLRRSGKARPWRWSLRSNRFHRWCAAGLAAI